MSANDGGNNVSGADLQTVTGGISPGQSVRLDEPRLFINRELSWIQFNRRVLEEARDRRHPLLERVKFLSIFASNLDEFMMIRVSGLRRQISGGVLAAPPDGMTPSEQLAAIRQELVPQLAEAQACWRSDILPLLNDTGIHIHRFAALSASRKDAMRVFFAKEIFPVLTPMAFDPGHPFPFISNLSLNLAVVIDDPLRGMVFSRLKVPAGLFSRLIRIPEEFVPEESEVEKVKAHHFLFLEDIVTSNLDMLFPGLEVVAAYPFRVTRDADLEIEEDEASDLITAIEESVELRRIGSPCRLEVNCSMPDWVREMIASKLGIPMREVYTMDDPVGMADLIELMRIDRPDLKDSPFPLSYPDGLDKEDEDIFAAIKRHDFLLYHPYDSFTPVINFIRQAVRDPDVLAIKQTLYRVGQNSPIVKALMEAREAGKQVAVLVELKARFDEANNIVWARALEREGVHVVYGLVGLKVHAKMCMVVRREKDGLTTYTHLSTGNYNATTARMYTDIGLFTADAGIGADVTDLFNAITGYSRKADYRTLLVSHGEMGTMRNDLLKRIEHEISRQEEFGDGYIAMKMNALVDQRIIRMLYRASQAGVNIDLQVRGICCLRPGIPGFSDRITVTSIVGRFLEHSRIYFFHNGGDAIILSGSADLMPRNLDRRVEILYPVSDPHIKEALHDILSIHLRDTAHARMLLPDGTYERVVPVEGEEAFDSQSWMLEHRGAWHAESE
ncbi:MAG: polyphosphate kinase 1 [Methanomicrobiaceae archaeon]|nr:polyphosphate kinase 1 [Methanomicrobiaceae archaeon]